MGCRFAPYKRSRHLKYGLRFALSVIYKYRAHQQDGMSQSPKNELKPRYAPRFSRSKTSPSRIHKAENEEVSLDPAEIDGLITDFYETKQQTQELMRKEKRLKNLIHRLLDITNSNLIKGRALELSRRVQQRRVITRSDVPQDVFDQYSRSIEVQMLYVKNRRENSSSDAI